MYSPLNKPLNWETVAKSSTLTTLWFDPKNRGAKKREILRSCEKKISQCTNRNACTLLYFCSFHIEYTFFGISVLHVNFFVFGKFIWSKELVMGGSIYHCYFLLMATDQAHVALAKYKKFPWMIWNVSRNEWNGAVGVKK